jgi:integrase
MSNRTVTGVPKRRETGWKRDGKARGIYWRQLAHGKGWGYYAAGGIHSAPSRQAAIDAKAAAQLRKSKGLPQPDTRVTIATLAEEIREQKRGRLRRSSFGAFEYALDKILLPELGHLRVVQVGPDRVARLVRELERRGLAASSIRRYLSPLAPVFKLAVRRGIVPTSPLALLSDDERPTGGGIREHYIWSSEEIARLVAAAEGLGQRREANYDYAPLIRLLVLTGLRVSEGLALRWCDVDLLEATIRVRHSLARDGTLTQPKTKAGRRSVPIAPGIVDMLTLLKPEDASDEDFVFSTTGRRPVSYHNFRDRGFTPAVDRAGLAQKGITIHGLRSAAISLYAARGLTMLETATVMGQTDASVTWRHYARLFDRSDVEARVRAAQASLLTAELDTEP